MPDWRKHLDAALSRETLDPARLLEIREEIAEHLDDRYNALVAEGLSPEDAEKRILAELEQAPLGAALRGLVNKQSHEAEGNDGNFLWASLRDIRYGWRQLRLSPGFALAALLSLALGVGATTAIFELVDAVRMRSLPVKDPASLVSAKIVAGRQRRVGEFRGVPELTRSEFEALRSEQQVFSEFSAWGVMTADLNRSGEVHYGRVLLAEGDLFALLGVAASRGRLIAPPDDSRGCANPPAVISYAYWQNEMGGRASVIGETVWANRHPFQVIGVTAPSFFGLEVGRRFSIALPLCAEPILNGEYSVYDSPKGWWLSSLGRLKAGISIPQASAQLAALSPSIMQQTLPPEYKDNTWRAGYLAMTLGAEAASTGYSPLRKKYDRPFLILLGIAGLVLLIACANVASLMLTRASSRRREMAVRLALGASRPRLLRQLLAESLLIAVLGASAGMLLAQWLSHALVPFLGSRDANIFVDLHTDWRVLLFSAMLALLTCVLFGLSPALQASRVAPAEAMKAGGRGIAGQSGWGLRRSLVSVQVGFSLLLVTSALLFVRTLDNLLKVDPGFRPDGLVVVNTDYLAQNIPVPQRLALNQELTRAVAAVPGVQSVARTRNEPLNGGSWNEQIDVPSAGTRRQTAWFNLVGPGYFKTIENSLIAGRDFNDEDTASSPKVSIISRTFATQLFHDPQPLGKTFSVAQYGDNGDAVYQVIGVAEDLKCVDLRSDFEPIAYIPDTQAKKPDAGPMLMIRSSMPPSTVIPAAREALLKVNPGLSLQFSTVKDDIADTLVAERLMAVLAGFFGALAAVLAFVGVYGVLSYIVAQRTGEIGIRMALGANRSNVIVLMLREVSLICGIGLVIGLGLLALASPAARTLVFGLRTMDAGTLVVGVLGVASIAVSASLIPAMRAAKVDPMVALHNE